MRLAIVGPGAMGTMLAVRLAATDGLEVTLVDHNRDRAAGLATAPPILELDNGILLAGDKVRITAAPARPFDFIILAVKSGDVAKALVSSAAIIAANGMIISLANGLSHLDALRSWPGPGYTAAGITAMGATMLSPGRVRFGGGGITVIGLMDRHSPTPAGSRLRQLTVIFNQTGIRTRISDNIDQDIWNKLMVNVGINGLTVIHDCRNGIIAEDPDLAAELAVTVREAMTVGEALGFSFPEDPVARALAVCRATSGNISSMLQDIRQGKKTEIMAINGAVVDLAAELGIAVPVNRGIVRKVLGLAKH